MWLFWSMLISKGTVTVREVGDDAAAIQVDERNKWSVFKKCAPFISFKTEINNTEINNAKDIDIVMRMYNFMEHLQIYGKVTRMSKMVIQKPLYDLNLK